MLVTPLSLKAFAQSKPYHAGDVLKVHCQNPWLDYDHYGIYSGGGKVIYYSREQNEVLENPLVLFSSGSLIQNCGKLPGTCYMPQQIVDRARRRLCEKNYDLEDNNCEHFVYWCATGKSYSPQVERVYGWFDLHQPPPFPQQQLRSTVQPPAENHLEHAFTKYPELQVLRESYDKALNAYNTEHQLARLYLQQKNLEVSRAEALRQQGQKALAVQAYRRAIDFKTKAKARTADMCKYEQQLMTYQKQALQMLSLPSPP
jgi:tetratricopeptide (TPR) repeat protein